MEVVLGNVGWETPDLHFPLASHSFPVIPRKKLIYLYGTLIFFPSYHQGDMSRLPGLVASSVYVLVPQDSIYLHTLKATAYEYDFQSA